MPALSNLTAEQQQQLLEMLKQHPQFQAGMALAAQQKQASLAGTTGIGGAALGAGVGAALGLLTGTPGEKIKKAIKLGLIGGAGGGAGGYFGLAAAGKSPTVDSLLQAAANTGQALTAGGQVIREADIPGIISKAFEAARAAPAITIKGAAFLDDLKAGAKDLAVKTEIQGIKNEIAKHMPDVKLEQAGNSILNTPGVTGGLVGTGIGSGIGFLTAPRDEKLKRTLQLGALGGAVGGAGDYLGRRMVGYDDAMRLVNKYPNSAMLSLANKRLEELEATRK